MARRTTKKEETQRKRCVTCNKEKAITSQNWYKSSMPLMTDGWFYSCKDCINNVVDSSNIDSVQWMLQIMDKPWISDQWSAAMKEVNERGWTQWSSYMKTIAMPQYQGMTWKDSEQIVQVHHIKNKSERKTTDKNEKQNESLNEKSNLTTDELQYLIEFWGKGFTQEEYEYLQMEYERLLNAYECDSYAMELLFQEVSHQRLTIKKKRESSQSVDKELKTLQDLLGSSNVKPAQESGANATEQATFGTLIKKYENERPIPEPEEAWKDVDGIAKYIRIWFTGHLSRMFGKRSDFQDEYEEEIDKFKVEMPEYQEGEE